MKKLLELFQKCHVARSSETDCVEGLQNRFIKEFSKTTDHFGMELRFENIFAAVLLILMLWIGIKMRQPLYESLICIGQIGPGHKAQEQWLGVLVLTILCFTFACLVKLLTHRDR